MTRATMRLVSMVLVMLFGIGGHPAHGSSCATPLVAVGPVDPVNGFPAYYIDSNDAALQPCLDVACDPAFVLPDPNAPLSFPDNFPLEFNYYRTTGKLTAGTIRVVYVAALIGSFGDGKVVLPGDQVVFARLRFRLSGATPGGVYTFTHPYGVTTVLADGVGNADVKADVGNASPLAFTVALDGGVGPFLHSVVQAPPGLIGDPANPQAVTGSPCGSNLLRVEGPGLPNGVFETDQFNLVGREAVLCGNGVLDPGEQCDDGNTLAGDCCSPACQFEAPASPCATNVCLDGMACDGAGVCGGGTPNMGPCDDGNACTTGDVCVGGTCVGGAAPDCNDNNPCTSDACDPASGCVNAPNALPCDDGNACTTGDTCAGGGCVPGPATNCDDGNPCTTDACDPMLGCTNTANTDRCNDGDSCTVNDACANGTCSGAPLVCPTATPLGPATGDAYVDSSVATTRLGGKSQLRVSASPLRRAILRMQVSGIGNRTVTSAVLNLKVSSTSGAGSVSGGRIHLISDCSWDEHTVTSQSQPLIDGPALAEVGPVKAGQTLSFDVTPAITGDGTYCFAIDSQSNDVVIYNSHEAKSGRPGLKITAACPCAAPPAPVCGDRIVNQPTEQCDGSADGACPGRCQADCTCAPAPSGGPEATIEADTFVESDRPTTNLGAKSKISVDAGVKAVERAFLRIRVSGIGGRTVSSAHVRLQVANVLNANSISGGAI